jgi:hypothetical protein
MDLKLLNQFGQPRSTVKGFVNPGAGPDYFFKSPTKGFLRQFNKKRCFPVFGNFVQTQQKAKNFFRDSVNEALRTLETASGVKMKKIEDLYIFEPNNECFTYIYLINEECKNGNLGNLTL